MPDEQVHAFVNDLMRPVGTHLYDERRFGSGMVHLRHRTRT